MEIPKDHPRYRSLKERHKLIELFREGIVAEAGLIAHGRGEAFDYLLGERTTPEAELAEKVAVAMLLLAERPIISVNGNSVALAAEKIIELAEILNAKIEVNLFYRTPEREKKIEAYLLAKGAKEVLGTDERFFARIPRLKSARGKVDKRGILVGDVILVPLEDGDRTEALVALGKKVIAIDLNPLSRTSQKATISIVDNITRAIPNMINFALDMRSLPKKDLERIVNSFDNQSNLKKIERRMRKGI
ncbi:MAG: hypothetical protein DRO65_01625 [Candidatus Altiarchaeales archaeon]|nr:MAG: hypothetical protein DRO65_01625 [Candidatus Altiarchaeales archaeon]